jgi:hypothetical protein
MSRVYRHPITALVLIVAVPLVWFGCGGGSKPPESPADQGSTAESSSAASSSGPSGSDTSTPAASASTAPPAEASSAATPSSETTAASAPPPPSFGSTDCGKCIDKACGKEAAACGKNADCQVTLEGIHSCSSGGAACLESGTPPAAAKPKKLATAYEACGKRATASKACKPKCH